MRMEVLSETTNNQYYFFLLHRSGRRETGARLFHSKLSYTCDFVSLTGSSFNTFTIHDLPGLDHIRQNAFAN